MLKTIPICALTLALAGCVTTATQESPAMPSAVEYSLTPCFGFCPSFALSLDADGKGTYRGEAFVKQQGKSMFEASPEQVAAFVERIAPYRPESSVSYGYENCDGPVATDSPTVTITWKDADAAPVTLEWYMGCRQPGLNENRDALYRAWQELPVGNLVGDDEERMNYPRYE